MTALKQFGLVRVRQLLHSPDHYDGWNLNQRLPRVGDTGCIVDILQAPDAPDVYVVECIGADGVNIWLAEFAAEEIEVLPSKE